jgi:hypothetical protein
VLFHGCASAAIHLVVANHAQPLLKGAWIAATLASGLPFVAVFIG